eukprot:scaffold21729_cov85-Phaeocystis_antarctica.AAC.9
MEVSIVITKNVAILEGDRSRFPVVAPLISELGGQLVALDLCVPGEASRHFAKQRPVVSWHHKYSCGATCSHTLRPETVDVLDS